MAALSVDQIRQLVTPFVRGNGAVSASVATAMELDKIDKAFSENVSFNVAGQEGFKRSVKAQGKHELKQKMREILIPSILGSLDTQLPYTNELVNVVTGGDSKWAACELKLTGTSKNSKPFILESSVFLQLDEDGKICNLRLYNANLQLQNYLQEVGV